jgi:hypothetical protein
VILIVIIKLSIFYSVLPFGTKRNQQTHAAMVDVLYAPQTIFKSIGRYSYRTITLKL